MRSSKYILPIQTLVATTLAGQITINNNCDGDIYEVTYGATAGNTVVISDGSTSVQPILTRADGGIQLGFTKMPPQTDQPSTMLEYQIQGDVLYYDVSNINGDPFPGQLSVTPSGQCQVIDNSAFRSCPADTSLTVDFCTTTSSKKAFRSARTLQA